MEDQEKIAVDVKRELGQLTAQFFRAVSFTRGSKPAYADLNLTSLKAVASSCQK